MFFLIHRLVLKSFRSGILAIPKANMIKNNDNCNNDNLNKNNDNLNVALNLPNSINTISIQNQYYQY